MSAKNIVVFFLILFTNDLSAQWCNCKQDDTDITNVSASLMGDKLSVSVTENGVMLTDSVNIRQCMQIWAEDSGATAAGVYDYSFGNGNELAAAANQNWGVLALYDGEIVAYGLAIDDPVTQNQTVALTIDEISQVSVTVTNGQSEALQSGLNIPVAKGQVINWLTTAGNANDVMPTIIICYDIQ